MIIPQLFNPEVLSPAENLVGQAMTYAQLKVLHNDQLILAQEILALTYQPGDKDHDYGLTLAYKQGQLDNIIMLLTRAEEANLAIGANGLQQLSKEESSDDL